MISLELVAFDEGQSDAIEHEADIDEEQAGIRASKQELLFQQFTQAAPIGHRVQCRAVGIERHRTASALWSLSRGRVSKLTLYAYVSQKVKPDTAI